MHTENLINLIRSASVDESVPILEAVLNGTGWLFDRRDVRFDVQPYTQLRHALKYESPEVSTRLSRTCEKLLQKIITKTSLLQAHGEESLFVVLRDCSPDITPIIVQQVSNTVFQSNHDQHARLLQALIAMSQKQNVRFWTTQNEFLGAKYAAVTYSGLLLHGLDIAAPYFATFFTSPASLSDFVPTISWLINTKGTEQTIQFLKRASASCAPHIRSELSTITDMFQLNVDMPSDSQSLFFGATLLTGHRLLVPQVFACRPETSLADTDAKHSDTSHQRWDEPNGVNQSGWECAA